MATGDPPADYQDIPQVAQLWASRANAVIYGLETRIEAVDKQLANFDLTPDA